ncbi:hypothetical protein [Streptomyces globosus]|uniref:hypothetical protein n=1 Tax=Streptomyces globosus TaxID=68209 RepID=UPI001C1F365A|nr:hypothetical protein [Streptomyces globosus]
MERVFGIEADLFNDDRPARALDAIALHPEMPAGTVGAPAIAESGIDCSRLHWDMTGMSVHGAYREAGHDEDFPAMRRPVASAGPSRRRHQANPLATDLKQLTPAALARPRRGVGAAMSSRRRP